MKIKKERMKTKYVRLTEKQWNFIEEMAKQQAEKFKEPISGSDVIRYAVDLFMVDTLR